MIEVSQATPMRILGSLLVILSTLEFGIGGVTYSSIENVFCGAWWSAILTFVAGVCGCFSSNRNVVIAGCVIAIVGALGALAGVIIDAISYSVFVGEITCSSTNGHKIYGDLSEAAEMNWQCWYNMKNPIIPDPDSVSIASSTVEPAYFNYYYNYNYHQFYYSFRELAAEFDCLCMDRENCYGYTLGTLDNCGDILTTYTGLLSGSVIIVFLLLLASIIYAAFTCVSLCDKRVEYSSVLPVDGIQMTEQPSVITSTQPQPAVQYVLPPMGYAQPVQYAPVEEPPQFPAPVAV